MKAVRKSRGILIIISFFIFLVVNKSLLVVSSVAESSRGYSTLLLRNEVINKLGNTFYRMKMLLGQKVMSIVIPFMKIYCLSVH